MGGLPELPQFSEVSNKHAVRSQAVMKIVNGL
jgi:hypothetical protein